MVWRDADGFTHLAGTSVGMVETLSGASPVW